MLLNSSDQRLVEETRIVYHIDDEETPYLVKLNVPLNQVRLIDFKNALNLPRCNYKFFFKSMDDDFGVVKEEIVDDQARLPCFKGRVVSWLVTAEDSALSSTGSGSQTFASTRKHLQQREQLRNRAMSSLDSMSETSDFDTCTEIDSQINSSKFHHRNHDFRYDTSSVLTSDIDSTTFVDSDDDDDDDNDYQTNEDDYEDLDEDFDQLTQMSGKTGDTSVSKAAEHRERRRKRLLIQAKLQQQQLHGMNNTKNKSKNAYAKLNRSLSCASSTSSITDSTMSLNIITVTLHLTSVNFLGISIVGQSYKNGDGGIYVGSIMSGGAVAADGRIDPGDMILQVNEINFENLSNDKAVEVLREAVSKPGPIKLVIAKCCFPQSNNTKNNSKNNFVDILESKKQEPVRPIDPRAWVEHTKIAQGLTDPGTYLKLTF